MIGREEGEGGEEDEEKEVMIAEHGLMSED